MQSGKKNCKKWLLEYIPETPMLVDPLMGWNSAEDTLRQVKLEFPSQEAAIAYARQRSLAYEISEPHQVDFAPKSYAANFAHNRIKT